MRMLPLQLAAVLAIVPLLAHYQIPRTLRQEQISPPNAALRETFTALTSVRELSDGRVLLSDPRETRLVLADFATQRIESIGRRGQGPGEFSTAVPFHALGGDSSVSADGLARRWLLFDREKIVATRTVNDREVRAVIFPYGFDTNGYVLTTQDPPSGPSGNTLRATDSTYMVLVSRSSGHLDTIGRLRPPPPSKANDPPVSLRVYEHAVLTTDGWVAIARLDPYRVDWRMPDGRWVRGAPLPVPAEPMDNAEKNAYQGSLRGGQRLGTINWPATLPPFTVGFPLISTMDGRVLVRRPRSVHNPGSRYDVINRRGEIEKQLVLPANERILGFGRSSVYVVVKDETDLETLRRHSWR